MFLDRFPKGQQDLYFHQNDSPSFSMSRSAVGMVTLILAHLIGINDSIVLEFAFLRLLGRWASVHMLSGHLCFLFCELSVQIFCPLFSVLFVFLSQNFKNLLHFIVLSPYMSFVLWKFSRCVSSLLALFMESFYTKAFLKYC